MPKSVTSLLSQIILSPFFVHNLFEKRKNGIYQYLTSYSCFQTKALQVLSFLLIYLVHFQVFHRREKVSCHQQNYKYLCLVRKIKSHLNKYLTLFNLLGLLKDGGVQKGPHLPKICHTYFKLMKLGIVIRYLKKIQKT